VSEQLPLDMGKLVKTQVEQNAIEDPIVVSFFPDIFEVQLPLARKNNMQPDL
jgi:hypothetical protein